MEMALARYVSGAAFFVDAIYRKGGKRVAVFDRTIRWRAAARHLRRSGRSPRQIAILIGRPSATVERVLRASFPRPQRPLE